MQKVRTLLKYHDLTIEVESHPGDELIQHMVGTMLGTPGGFQYYHTNIADRLHSLDENYFLYLRKSGKMLGSVGFCGREAEALNYKHDVWLVRYFAIKAPMRSTPSTKVEAGDTLEKRTSVLGRFIKPVAENPSFLRSGDQKKREPGVIYGIIDKTNLRSSNFAIQSGLESIGDISFFPFSRFHPKSSDRLHVLKDKEHGTMIKLLNAYYKEYTFFSSDNLFKNQDYYIMKDGDEIVAGFQTYDVAWKIVHFGTGFVNKLIGLMTKIPYFKQRLNPKNLELLAFDGIYIKKGYENTLYELMEAVLAHKKKYIALLIMDVQSELNMIFENIGKRGFLYKLLGSFNANIMARFIDIPDEVQEYYKQHPKYISSYDNS